MFDNFDNFSFIDDMLAEPLTITVPGVDTRKRDEHGHPIIEEAKTFKVEEAIVNNTNPNFQIDMGVGGTQTVGTLYWRSKTSGYPKGTQVVRDEQPNIDYEVTAYADDPAAGLTYYSLKEVGANEQRPNLDQF